MNNSITTYQKEENKSKLEKIILYPFNHFIRDLLFYITIILIVVFPKYFTSELFVLTSLFVIKISFYCSIFHSILYNGKFFDSYVILNFIAVILSYYFLPLLIQL